MRVSKNECAKAIQKVCEQFGAAVVFEHDGKHPVAVVTLGKNSIRQVFPSTASDKRSALNCASFTRRTLRAWSGRE